MEPFKEYGAFKKSISPFCLKKRLFWPELRLFQHVVFFNISIEIEVEGVKILIEILDFSIEIKFMEYRNSLCIPRTHL